jgi:hypothetical protein
LDGSSPPQADRRLRFHFASRLTLAVLAIAFVSVGTFPALAQAPAKKPSYENYRMVRTRNIFDPDRKPNAPVSKPAAKPAGTAPAAAADYVALTGVLLNGDKALAFFSGSRSEYNKVLTLKSTIADVTIVGINEASIEVERAGKRIVVGVGQTIPKEGTAPAPAPIPSSSSADSAFSQGSANATTSSPAAGMSPDKEAILRRMMERRKKELK